MDFKQRLEELVMEAYESGVSVDTVYQIMWMETEKARVTFEIFCASAFEKSCVLSHEESE